ncbi:LuxR C-terminal-related transcriptional regulator, partial [Kitasatospora sp. NPDC004531]
AAAAYLAAGLAGQVPELLAAAELGPLDPLQQAHVHRLRAEASERGAGAVTSLLDAVDRLAGLDPAAARETCLTAFGAAIRAGREDAGAVRRVAEAARALPGGEEPAGLLLDALTGWALEGTVAAQPSLARAVRAGAAVEDPSLLWAVADAAAELGDLAAWLASTERAVGAARATGAFSALAAAVPYRATALAFAGRFGEARSLLAGAAAVAGVGAGVGVGAVAGAGAGVEMLMGAYLGRERPGADGVEREGGRFAGVAALARAVLANGQGNYPAAMDAALVGVAHRDLAVHHWTCGELVEAAVRAGRPEVAAGARDRLAEWARAGTPWAVGAHAVAEALVGGASEGAESCYREGVAEFARGGLGVFEARARLLYGEWLRRQNRRGQAREELRAAYEACEAMGLAAFAERARQELLATGETVRRREVGGPVLTPQEARIARLAAGGCANAEIGAQLFLSPRTVEWHLRKVFGKLGISSRREIEGVLGGAQ